MSRTSELIKTAESIKIVSGEGTVGTVEEYTGKRTLRALKLRLTKERCNGDRWAHVLIEGLEIHIEEA